MNETWRAHNVASAVVESMKRHKRKPSDFYPTPPAATVAMLKELGLEPGMLLADPACGRGDIVMTLAYLGYPAIATDLRQTGFGGGGIDFLDPTNDWRWDGVEGSIQNPPFALAEQFIRRSVELFPVTAMLLKSNYWHANKRRKLRQECPPTAQYEVTWRLAFLEEERGKSPLMDCTWWVWKRGDPPMPEHLLIRPPAAEVPKMRYPLAVHVADNRFARERLNGLLED